MKTFKKGKAYRYSKKLNDEDIPYMPEFCTHWRAMADGYTFIADSDTHVSDTPDWGLLNANWCEEVEGVEPCNSLKVKFTYSQRMPI